MEYKLILDYSVLEKYNQHYFKLHPKAKKIPIQKPYMDSINQWMILPRIQMNARKQIWKNFVVWWLNDLGYSGLMLEKVELEVIVYRDTKRLADIDNICCTKFFQDGLVEGRFIVDDNYSHLTKLTLHADYDKEYPRTEFIFTTIEED